MLNIVVICPKGHKIENSGTGAEDADIDLQGKTMGCFCMQCKKRYNIKFGLVRHKSKIKT